MKAYKLTDENNRTYNDTQWGINVSHTATGTTTFLCSDGWIHFYTHPLLAVLMNPNHAKFVNPKLWEAEASGEMKHELLKSGCKTLTTIREIPLPKVSRIQRIAFVILCAKEVCKDEKWNSWADKWLSGEDRSKETADVAAYAAFAAANADANAAAANADANAAAAFHAAGAAAYADANAAGAAANAAGAAAVADGIDFIKIAKKALTIS